MGQRKYSNRRKKIPTAVREAILSFASLIKFYLEEARLES